MIYVENGYEKFFLGANSCEGFVSHFGDCYDPADGWRVYIIKGGPGTGKSSFMKYIAAQAREIGFTVTLCMCSSDPNSLDGIIVRENKTVFLDGTAPHTVEPKFAGACEEIINLGEFWDGEYLKSRADEIMAVSRKNSEFHRAAAMYLSAAGDLMLESLARAKKHTEVGRAVSFAKGLCRRKIPRKADCDGKEWVRFISGITPLGVVTYADTALSVCSDRVIVSDKHGSVSSVIMGVVREWALAAGYEIITLKNPFLPSRLCDHIIIPELSLCFLTENRYITFNCDARRIHSRRFMNVAGLNSSKQQLRFCDRTAAELVECACQMLAKAKDVHDSLEKFYIDAMDFAAVGMFAESTAEKIFI